MTVDIGQKVDNRSFVIVSSVVLAITLILAIGRMYIKVTKFRRLFVDDYFFIAANVVLAAGTAMIFTCLPYNQTQVNVGAGIEAPGPDLTHRLDMDVKYQDSGVFLLNAAIYFVKFSFLFFFRLILENTGKLKIWWWCVFIFTIPCAVVAMCTNFMICPAFGDKIMEVCVSQAQLKKQIAILYMVVILDILTDVMLISIPILFLWSVRINLRRKIGLGSLLCLSILAVITNIIRASGHKLNNGQDDVVWILFWEEMEACVAVVANSMTAFRSLFATSSSQLGVSPPPQEDSSAFRLRHRKRTPRIELPTAPTATLSGLRSFMSKDPFEDREALKNGSGIQVTRSFQTTSSHGSQTEHSDWHEMHSKKSQETFV